MKKLYSRLLTSFFVALISVSAIAAPISAAEPTEIPNDLVVAIQTLQLSGSGGIGNF